MAFFNRHSDSLPVESGRRAFDVDGEVKAHCQSARYSERDENPPGVNLAQPCACR